MQPRHDGADRNVERLGDFFIGESLDIHELDHRCKSDRQFRKRLLNLVCRERVGKQSRGEPRLVEELIVEHRELALQLTPAAADGAKQDLVAMRGNWCRARTGRTLARREGKCPARRPRRRRDRPLRAWPRERAGPDRPGRRIQIGSAEHRPHTGYMRAGSPFIPFAG